MEEHTYVCQPLRGALVVHFTLIPHFLSRVLVLPSHTPPLVCLAPPYVPRAPSRHCHGYRVREWEARVVMIHVDWISGWDAWSSGVCLRCARGEGGREGREREGGDEEDEGGVEEVLGARWDEVEPRR
jgi:hypothetical protein